MQSEQFQLHAAIEDRHWWFVARRRIVCQLVEEILPPSQGHTVIDVGCGTGANLAALAGGYRCIGIDTSSEAIALAQRRFPEVKFIHGFAPQDLGDAIRDARLIMLNDVLEHVEDDTGLLKALVDAATPGTQFLITVPADMALWSPHDVAFGHFRRYDLEQFKSLWSDLPVKQKLASYFNSRLYPAVRWIRERNHRRGRTTGNAGTDFTIPSAPVNALLKQVFQSESRSLLDSLNGDPPAYRRGVSLIGVLERQPSPTPAII